MVFGKEFVEVDLRKADGAELFLQGRAQGALGDLHDVLHDEGLGLHKTDETDEMEDQAADLVPIEPVEGIRFPGSACARVGFARRTADHEVERIAET
jgi:hypothetical protein